ncbi:MAG: STAS domain-containing protein [Verrucomicrobiae bacterium]|nr:STAS domain-containing protein [Verrucomicrobiae bacterium]
MDIQFTEKTPFTIVTISGRLDASCADEAIQSIDARIKQGSRKLIMNLSKLEYASSAGLRVFLLAAKKTQGLNGSVEFCGINDLIAEIFEINGFKDLFPFHSNEEEALKNFKQ